MDEVCQGEGEAKIAPVPRQYAKAAPEQTALRTSNICEPEK